VNSSNRDMVYTQAWTIEFMRLQQSLKGDYASARTSKDNAEIAHDEAMYVVDIYDEMMRNLAKEAAA